MKKQDEVSGGVLTGSYLAAAFFPCAGFIMGIYLLFRGKPGHGLGVIVLSLFMSSFWVAFVNGFLVAFMEAASQGG
jgi:hypothetical protein